MGLKKRYDKINSCTFCDKQICSKITRHLLTHKDRTEIMKIMTLGKKSSERAAEFAVLVNEGNYKHSISVLTSGSGILITARCECVSQKKHKIEDYYPCEFCKGFYLKKLLWHHARNCKVRKHSTDDDNESRNSEEGEESANYLRNSRTLLYCSLLDNDEDKVISPLLKQMQDGDVKNVVVKDTLIRPSNVPTFSYFLNSFLLFP